MLGRCQGCWEPLISSLHLDCTGRPVPFLVLLLDQGSQLCKGKGLPWLAMSKVSVPDDLSACLFGRVHGGIAHDGTASHGHSPQGLLSIWLYLQKPPLCPQTQHVAFEIYITGIRNLRYGEIKRCVCGLSYQRLIPRGSTSFWKLEP